MNRLPPIICLIFISLSSYAQLKFEKEERIKQEDVPVGAVRFVDSMQLSGRIKWFKEIGYNKISYEAKTKHQGKRLSIEFSEEGIFEDAEVEIKSAEITQVAFKKISDYLQEAHAKFKINKVQIQYSGDTHCILNYFLREADEKSLTINYEIVITTKTDGAFVMYEYLFGKNGVLIQKSRVTSRMTDNLEF
ncbi:MAG: hypothetical protein AAGF96_14600 [Bacteroidota bacterium]